MKTVVLGAGLVGGPIAADLALDPGRRVRVVDVDGRALARVAEKSGLETLEVDLSTAEGVRRAVAGADDVVSAVPGFMGFETLRRVIEEGKNVVDIAFFAEDPLALDDLARRAGVTAVVDCGVAPGMSNVLAAHAASLLDEAESLVIYVGGLPQIREWPFEYRAVFSPVDVIEEYLRPARVVENGALVVRPALSEPELVDLPGIGTLEAFNTDGLRTLARTMRAPNMKEKTLRYPGHIEKIAVLRDAGFFGKDEVQVGEKRVRPLDVTARLLMASWRLRERDRDVTVFQLSMEGTREGKRRRYVYDMLDRYDETSGVHSMARTTGYAASQALRMIERGLYRNPGVNPPELFGRRPECVEFLLKGLAERGIAYRETVS